MTEPAALFQEHYLLPSTVDGAIWPFTRDYLKPRHFHAQLELLLVLRGNARVRVGRALHAVHAGHIVWQLPGVEHAIVEASSDCNLRVIHVETDLCAKVSSELGATGLAGPGEGSRLGWARQLGALVSGRPVVELKQRDRDALLEECEVTCADAGIDPELVPTRLIRALSIAWRATRCDHDDGRPLSLVELASCLLFDEPSLERSELCRSLDISEGYLSRRFQVELGISLSQQRARMRVSRFVTQVNRERQNYLEAALASGFGSYSQLHRVFTGITQTSPRNYFSTAARNARANRTSLL